jgi:PPP family 3-phenylpropionic acid transporter
MGKNFTLRYSVIQFFYSAVYCASGVFATTYLLGKGLSSGLAGTLLALAGLLACLTQPFLASYADRSKKFVLPWLMLALSGLCVLCFGMQLLPDLPLLPAGILYVLGFWCGDAMAPLVNALCVACNEAGYTINFGIARGLGSAASAVASLALGHIIAKLGNAWMFLLFISFEIITIIAIIGFRKVPKVASAQTIKTKTCTIPEFFSKYRWFSISLLGIGCLAIFHCMIENYMIAIMQRLGGDSSHVGTALFIACISGAPVIFFFQAFRRRCKNTTLMMISACAFLVKAVLIFFARSIQAVYLIQLMQTCTYAILCPAQVYYAGEKVQTSDMVKGQAFMTAIFSLGCSCGNFMGGQLLNFGVDALLLAGIATALLGTVILGMTVNKKDLLREV